MNESDTVHIIAADQRLSQSLIWEIQRRYFRQKGMKAWQAGEVPHAISSNPYMARAYAQVALGYLHDCLAASQRGILLLTRSSPSTLWNWGPVRDGWPTTFGTSFILAGGNQRWPNCPLST